GFAFDVELLYLARKADLDIIEVPITWYYMEASSVRPVRDTWRMFKEVMRIRANEGRGLYR
ncbi:MAG: glycosyltransferase family 2 protein, partial [Myxococcota bacterium]|nr:glycosyltransferase family 2 protein [Myxococcota bacterium]